LIEGDSLFAGIMQIGECILNNKNVKAEKYVQVIEDSNEKGNYMTIAKNANNQEVRSFQ